MFKPHTILAFGLWLVALSFLGIPAVWKIRLYVVTGIVFVLIYLVHLGKEVFLKLAISDMKNADTFTENGIPVSSSKSVEEKSLAGHE